jgi:hypothetical protein
MVPATYLGALFPEEKLPNRTKRWKHKIEVLDK